MYERQRGEAGEQRRRASGELQPEPARREPGHGGGIERRVVAPEYRQHLPVQQTARQPQVRRPVGMDERVAQEAQHAHRQADREGGGERTAGTRLAAERHGGGP
jgi:hypothetical protein